MSGIFEGMFRCRMLGRHCCWLCPRGIVYSTGNSWRVRFDGESCCWCLQSLLGGWIRPCWEGSTSQHHPIITLHRFMIRLNRCYDCFRMIVVLSSHLDGFIFLRILPYSAKFSFFSLLLPSYSIHDILTHHRLHSQTTLSHQLPHDSLCWYLQFYFSYRQ